MQQEGRARQTPGLFSWRGWRAALAVASVLVAGVSSAVAQDRPPAHRALDRDLAQFVSWFEGRFDNELQVFFESDLGVAEAARHDRIHSSFRRIDLPAFGEHVFYVEQNANGDPAQVYRQRFYVVRADYDANAIRLDVHTPRDPAPLRAAYRDPVRLAALAPADAPRAEGCSVFWRRQSAQFIGADIPSACRIRARHTGRALIVRNDLVLSADTIWIRDRAADTRGRHVFGNRAGVPHELRRVRPFECWVAILHGARHGDAGVGAQDADWFFQRGVLLHDQGGAATITTDESPARQVRLKLRRVDWPFGSNRPSLTLYVMEEGSERAVSYAWGEYDADRIGINLRWMQASCTHAPERLWDVP
jgi:hypothetical protein